MNHPKEMLAGKKRAKKGTKLNDYYIKSKWQNNLIENDVRYKKNDFHHSIACQWRF